MSKSKMWQVGDVLRGTMHNSGVECEILEVRDTGYTWRYPDIPDKDFWSENSCDPFFEWGWEINTSK